MSILRAIAKGPLNAVGLDLVRYHPQYSIGQYAYIASLKIKTVIDVGAHTGEFAKMIAGLMPGVSILSFEPQQAEFAELENNLRSIASAQAFKFALGDRNEKLDLHRSAFSQSSSLRPMTELHKEAFPESAGESLEQVEVRRLDDALSDLEIAPEVLLKIDAQGYEDKVLAGAPQILTRAKAAIIEVSFRELYEGQPLFDSIYRTMHDFSFSYSGNLYQLVHPHDRSVLQADALFVRL
ncbi:MAG TPA: FkbM family methyltransferase [Pyrinomonadaceae bacterium]|nr:FkbM family methyltransferase [Pyrinomonadaceae bacterium]